MDKWEYIIIKTLFNTKDNSESILNELGEEGWELINVNTTSFYVSYTFKRKKI